MKSGQKGFTIVETLLLLILLAILGFTGYYVYHSQKQTDKTLKTASNEQLATPAKKSSTNKPDTAAAEKEVNDFYAAYLKATQTDDQNQSNSGATNVVAQYGTQNFINNYPKIQNRGYDPVFCAQNIVESISVLDSSVNPSGSVTVNISRQGYGDTSTKHPSVTIVGSKIDSISCPTP